MIGEDFRFGSTWLSDFDMKMYDPSNEQAFPEIAIEKSDMSSQLSKPNHFGLGAQDILYAPQFQDKILRLCHG